MVCLWVSITLPLALASLPLKSKDYVKLSMLYPWISIVYRCCRMVSHWLSMLGPWLRLLKEVLPGLPMNFYYLSLFLPI